jgi:hypothetical protein
MKILFLFFAFSSSIISFGGINEKNIKLGIPILIQGKNKPIKINYNGYAHPAVYDWNQDGKKDLIIGEFSEKARFRVYLNEGTDAKPKFSGNFFYGKDVEGKSLFVASC